MSRYTIAGLTVMVAMATAFLWIASKPEAAMAHCQVPCGIYDDAARINRLREDAATIAKAVRNIQQMAGSHDTTAFNQAARWVNTKEEHASHIIDVVSKYFLTQKVKVVTDGGDAYQAYLKKLADHHAVMAAAMKTKQTVSPEAVHNLEHAIEGLAKHYKK